MKFVIQNNLGNCNETQRMIEACKNSDIEVIEYKVIPFSDELPSIPNDNITIFYGSCNWITLITNSNKWNPGTFFNDSIFNYENYISQYGPEMLNHDAFFTTFGNFHADTIDKFNPDDLVFVKPTRDVKEFSGDIIEYGNFLNWVKTITYGNYLPPETKILIKEPINIALEYRIFIVDGKPVTGSCYRVEHRLDVSSDVPDDVYSYCSRQIEKADLAPVYVMDIGILRDGTKKIIELGAFNSAGLYASDENKIIQTIKNFFKEE